MTISENTPTTSVNGHNQGATKPWWHQASSHLTNSSVVEDDLLKQDNGRYRRILFFFARLILHLIVWDIFGSRIPLLRGYIRQTRPTRLRKLSYRFRLLAIEMGGVLIKLGQFLSARVDVLPLEITEELQGLQDEVPPVATQKIWEILQAEYGDLSTHFVTIEETPLAAASLGQVHRAKLKQGNDAVVIKVQRPHIRQIVQTDLAALRIVARWTMRYKPIRRRADVPALMEEFARTLWEELDYNAEIANAERFAHMFAHHENIYIPRIYKTHSTARVIVLEDVESIKITDVERMTQAGIDPKIVAQTFFDTYFHQIFREGFFHADPHPGNLFVRPRTESEDGQQSFWLIFVDFGMVGRVPTLVGENLRQVLISITQKDAHKLTEAYNNLGFFLPGADLERINEAQAAILERIWGRNLMELARPDPDEVAELGKEFRDLLYEFPIQVPQDFVYLGRAIGMVSGLVSQLDPEINPWYLIERHGREILAENGAAEFSIETIRGLIQPYLAIPGQIQRIIKTTENGRLKVQTTPDKETIRRLQRLEKRITQLNWSILGAAGIIATALLWRDKN